MRYSRPIGLVAFLFVSTNIFLVYRSLLPRPVIRDSIWLAAREYRLSLSKNISHEDISSPSKFQVRVNHTILTFNVTKAIVNLTASSVLTQNGTDSVRIVKKEIIHYPKFKLTEPNFITNIGKERFYKHSENGPKVGVPTGEKLIGEIVTIRKGTFSMPFNCGYRSDVSHVIQKRGIPQNHWYRSVVPLIVPDGGTFQHFLDGTLPKIIQALDYIQQPQVRLLLPTIRDKIIFEILEKLNISRGKLVLGGEHQSVGADYLVFTCVTPPLHPLLWQRARTLLGVPEKLAVPQNRGNIVIITRKGSHNGGRHLLNKETLLSKLQDKYLSVKVSMYLGPYNLNDTIKLFGSTSVVIGVHGGGLYNINFCPPNTTVIEIMPTYSNGKMVAAAHQIFWMQSVLLEHQYWRIAADPASSNGDVNVNITQVENIIDKSWGIL